MRSISGADPDARLALVLPPATDSLAPFEVHVPQGAIDDPSGASRPLLRARTLLGVARGIQDRQAAGTRPTPPAPP